MRDQRPRVVAWETTRRCALRCAHCRGAARDHAYANELSLEEGCRLLDGLAAFSKPLLILTGGEPLMRPDIFDLAAHGSALGMRMVMATCGHMLDAVAAERMKASGIRAVSISLDAATAPGHDAFRGVQGAFEDSLRGIAHLKSAGIPFQINTTVTRRNVAELDAILSLAVELGASTFDLFFLVPTGRGSALAEIEISAEEHEAALLKVQKMAARAPIRVKTTCAPHYARIQAQGAANEAPSAGCMGGRGFVFVSHTGILQPCGFLDIPCGDLRRADFDFARLYDESRVFKELRDPDGYRGKCGACEYRWLCGGCRARAYTHTGDYLAEEPACAYAPGSLQAGGPAPAC